MQKNNVAQELRKCQIAKESNMHKKQVEKEMQNNQFRSENEFVQELKIQGIIYIRIESAKESTCTRIRYHDVLPKFSFGMPFGQC